MLAWTQQNTMQRALQRKTVTHQHNNNKSFALTNTTSQKLSYLQETLLFSQRLTESMFLSLHLSMSVSVALDTVDVN